MGNGKNLLEFADELKLSGKAKEEAVKILGEFMKDGLDLHVRENPDGYLGAVIYLADRNNDKRYSQRDIAEKLDISDATLSAKYKLIKEKLKSNKLLSFFKKSLIFGKYMI